uniref:Uncharacterized protein n=1 Tax=Leptocylindrus danicus TaxID=163516 RepID=A0A7S2P0U7_9STRA|eukprot:CAMPEP_0116027024 /NCGR_PEP_ID=MMETSP0321-20121206/14329_1 /TAXON_ID=163516 /ORGANISM="Leptocylindrus danicus var. danicus, Strain B650" /LENGTH=441 /DNA_ID=CAMNT_0003500193 /DNA_START=42 /DNA_END=1367 /DNA_ORIENTATION=-
MSRLAVATAASFIAAANADPALTAALMKKAQLVPGSKTIPDFMMERKLDGYAEEEQQWSFDPTNYSLKYARCQMVEQYSDEVAEDAGQENQNGYVMTTVVKKQRFAVFRLCPSSFCSSKSQFGCDSGYGEYMVDLGEYLQTMMQYNENKKENYCKFCEDCAAGNGDNRMKRRKLEGQEGEGEDEAEDEAEEEVNYCNVSACNNYQDTCEEQENYGDDEPIEYDRYFECQQVQGADSYGNELNLYVGPHCTNNAYSIKLDLFYDEFCTNYAGNKYKLNSFTGLNFESSGLSEYYDGSCVSCKESADPYANVDEDNEDGDDIAEVCEELYMQAAKCEEGISSSSSSKSYAEKEKEQIACTYISNVMKGAYDEKGQIYLDLKSYNAQEGAHSEPEAKVTGAQKFWMWFFILGCVGLGGYGAMLHKQLTAGGDKSDSLYSGGQMA